jgi:hypothetical protein
MFNFNNKMVLQSTDQLTAFEQLLFQQVKVVQTNKLGITGKLLDVIRDTTGLHKLNIEQEFISRGNVGKIVRESKPTVATVYTRNILTVERIE